MPLLICTSHADEARALALAARRVGAVVQVVAERCADPDGPWDSPCVTVPAERDARHVAAALDALAGISLDGIVALDDRAAWLAARLAAARQVPWHSPEAVAVSTHKLLARGRLLAAGLPVPRFVSLPAKGDDELDRLLGVRFPCAISPVGTWRQDTTLRVDSLTELLAARDRLATWLETEDGRATVTTDADTLLVESVVPGRTFVLAGVLEQGALRVLAVFEQIERPEGGGRGLPIAVTPAPLASARQQVLAGHVARAALVLGLHHGPIHAICRLDGDDIVVHDVLPRPTDGRLGRAIPVIDPDGARATLHDVLVAHALGRPLDGYGHEAIASGVLTVGTGFRTGESPANLAAVSREAADDGVEVVIDGAGAAAYARGARPEDVVARLSAIVARLRPPDGER